jgi:hypothetical protein
MATRRTNPSLRAADPAPSAGSPKSGAAAARSSAASIEVSPARRRPAGPKDQPAPLAAGPVAVSADTRRAMIAKAAYLRAERRGFAPGSEEHDWLSAEKEVDAMLSGGRSIPQ